MRFEFLVKLLLQILLPHVPHNPSLLLNTLPGKVPSWQQRFLPHFPPITRDID